MGLDMYAYVATKAGAQQEYWDQYEVDSDQRTVVRPREIAYWRKHPNLHGWMAEQWIIHQTGGEGTPEQFNGIELELTQEDLDELEQCVLEGSLPSTSGFFFGNEADDYYKEQDLEFIKNARAELFCGLKVFYNSSW
jgi:hypothetical protein